MGVCLSCRVGKYSLAGRLGQEQRKGSCGLQLKTVSVREGGGQAQQLLRRLLGELELVQPRRRLVGRIRGFCVVLDEVAELGGPEAPPESLGKGLGGEGLRRAA